MCEAKGLKKLVDLEFVNGVTYVVLHLQGIRVELEDFMYSIILFEYLKECLFLHSALNS